MRGSIWDELFRMREELDSLFEDFFIEAPRTNLLERPRTSIPMRKPLTDIYEEENNYVIKADIPGYNKEDIKINVNNGVLEIKAETKDEQKLEDKKKGTYRLERNYSGYYRQIPLPENVDENQIEAEYKNGVLELKAPKTKQLESKGKHIKIK